MPSQAVVRLLTRRNTGITRRRQNHPRPVDRDLLEISEVFRIDVITRFFEGTEPNLRVRFLFTEIAADEGMEVNYPLELPEPILQNRVCSEYWAKILFDALFYENQNQMLFLSRIYTEDSFMGESLRLALMDLPPNVYVPQGFFTHSGLYLAAAEFRDLSEDERDHFYDNGPHLRAL